MSSTRTMGISVTDTGTEQVMPLGFEYHEPASGDDAGERVWIYVQMKATDTVVGSVLAFTTGATTYTVRKALADSHAGSVVGVAQHIIVADSYGFILRKGKGSVLADAGGITADLGIMVGDAIGTADAAGAVTTASFGTAIAAADGVVGTAFLNCRG